MKFLFVALFSALTLTACGSSLSSVNDTVSPKAGTELRQIPVALAGVRVVAGKFGSFHTVAQLSYTVACHERLEKLSTAVNENNSQFTVHASAIVSSSPRNEIACMGFATETHEVVLTSGMISAEQVRLINLKYVPTGRSFIRETSVLRSVVNSQIVKIEPVGCTNDSTTPCDSRAIAVSIETIVPCTYRDASYAFAFDEENDGTLQLAVVAYGIESANTGDAVCKALLPLVHRIVVPTQRVFTAEQIRLINLF